MGRNKKYTGYKSFQYLEPDKDYRSFKLAKEIGRVEPYVVPLSKSEEEKVEEILESNIVISLHDHTVVFPEDMSQLYEWIRTGRFFTAYEGLSVSGLDAVFDNLMDGVCQITSNEGWKWEDIIYDIGMRLSDIAHQDFVTKCEKVSDILEAHKTGKVTLILTLESATPIENEVDRVEILYGLGIRCMGIVYSQTNMLGSGYDEERDGGLTNFGYDVVKRMNKIGMAIDVSHAGEQTCLGTIEASDKPIFLSHSAAKALGEMYCNSKSDEVLHALAEKGGVFGIMVSGKGITTEKNPEPSIESFMEHLAICVDRYGVDHVAAGPDTLYGDHVGLYRVWFPRRIGERQVGEIAQLIKSLALWPEYVKGQENPSEFLNIPRWLVKHGYSDEEIKKIIGGNVLRVLKEVW